MSANILIEEEEDDLSYDRERQRLIAWGKKHGGKYLALGAPSQVVESDLSVRRVGLIICFAP